MAVAPRLVPGSIFARDFQVIDLLAEGGMGAVYRAEQLSTRKLRALKLVSMRLAADPKARQRFVREATIGASIDSEHAVEVIGAGIDDESGHPWLAMELLDGADLGAVVQYQGPLHPAQLHEVVGQLCHGLAAAHRAGVVHRDLKPANVFIARSRRAGVPFTLKILDFGIAKMVQESGTGSSETDTVGSPLWMAPEQLNAQRPTPATDVWALGLLAFWALTGKHYWIAAHAEASNVQALFVEQLFKPIDPPSQRAVALGVPHALPAGFDEWFLECTQRDPARRFDDASAASEALRALLPTNPAAAAALLPHVSLAPSVSGSSGQPSGLGVETTMAATPTASDGPEPLPPVEDNATLVEPRGLGADLSHAPLSTTASSASSASTPGPRSSPFALMLSVSLLVVLLLGAGVLVWQWQSNQQTLTPDDDVEIDARAQPLATTSSDGEEGTSESTGSPTSPRKPIPTGPALDLVVPLRTQLDHEAQDLRFLGWSESGHRFVIEADYQADRKGEANRATLVQVHDTLSGVMVESFLMSREAGGSSARNHWLGRAAADAKPRDEWAVRRAALRLHKGKPQHAAGQAQLHIEAKSPPPGTHIELPPSLLGAAYRWSIDPTIVEVSPDREGPELTLSLEREGTTWDLLRFAPPFKSHQLLALLAEGQESPAAVGRILAYWSPDHARMLLLVDADARAPGEPPLVHHRWEVRTAGPQIRLVEAGAGQRRAREVAATLAEAGLPVTILDLRAKASSQSKIVYVQGEEPTERVAERIAEHIHAVLPVSVVPEAKRFTRDFVDVIVVLGHDAQ